MAVATEGFETVAAAVTVVVTSSTAGQLQFADAEFAGLVEPAGPAALFIMLAGPVKRAGPAEGHSREPHSWLAAACNAS